MKTSASGKVGKLLYLAAPYTSGDPEENTQVAIDIGHMLDLQLAGVATTFVPHLFHYWDERHPRAHESWMEKDIAMLSRCDGVLFYWPIGVRSLGMEEEMTWWVQNNGVFDSVGKLSSRIHPDENALLINNLDQVEIAAGHFLRLWS